MLADPSADEVLWRRIDWMRSGTAVLLDVCGHLDDTDPGRPSALVGWSRGHVLAHLAQNATALLNLLSWARTGVITPMYPSPQARAADIEAGATLPMLTLLSALRDTAAQLDEAVTTLPAQSWPATITTASGREAPASIVPWMRVREVWVHAIDLELGLGFGDIPDDIGRALIEDMAALMSPRIAGPAFAVRPGAAAGAAAAPNVLGAGVPSREIAGSTADLTAWLSGRAAPAALGDPAALPTLPAWL
jgi:maleylpyruvate isomerase